MTTGEPTTEATGWIGLGNMGYAMADNLAKALKPESVAVYNRTKKRSDELASRSEGLIEVCDSIAELVSQSKVIFICLADDPALEQTVEALLATDLAGRLVVEMSTVHPDTTRRVARSLEAAGAQFLAAPVFGAPAAAIAAKLVVAHAGKPAALERARPFFSHIARADFGLGEDPGLATLMKVTGNTFILSMIETIAEGLAFSEASGLGTDNCAKFVSTMFGNTPWEWYTQRMLTGGYCPAPGERPGFAVDVAHKDASHALDLAKRAGYDLSIVGHVRDNLDLARKDDRFAGRGDVSSVYGVERERAGLPLMNDAAKAKNAGD